MLQPITFIRNPLAAAMRSCAASVLVQAEQNEVYAQHALEAARDAKAAAEWALHDGVLGAKAQVLAQYGPNSDAIQSLGLKKKSKYRRP